MKNHPHGPDELTIESDVRPAPPRETAADRGNAAPVFTAGGHLSEGSRFGVYVVGACIGQGGMARVYRAEHEGLQRQVALKVLIDGVGQDGEAHERFLREARLAAAIKHPNVVNIFDVGVCEGTPYLVMELLEGVDLDALVESKGKLDEPTIVDVLVPIVAGLAAVHEAGIVHRDLKPGNIFLARGRNDDLEPKLLDFGISKSTGPDHMKLTSARGMMIGTPFYMAPEAARGADVTALSDQYALGVLMYECATGVNPFVGANNFAEVVSRVSTGSFDPVGEKNPTLSKKLVSIIETAMHIDPAQRFPDMRAMGRELLSLAGERTRITWGLSFADPSNPDQSARRDDPFAGDEAPAWRRKRRWAPAAAALIAVSAGVGLWLSGTREEAPVVLESSPKPGSAMASAMPLRPPAPSAGDVSKDTSSAAIAVAIPTARASDTSEDLAEISEPRTAAAPSKGSSQSKASSSAQPQEARAKERPRRERPRRRATPPPVPSVTEPPDWVPTATAAADPAPSTGRGTNNAPILD